MQWLLLVLAIVFWGVGIVPKWTRYALLEQQQLSYLKSMFQLNAGTSHEYLIERVGQWESHRPGSLQAQHTEERWIYSATGVNLLSELSRLEQSLLESPLPIAVLALSLKDRAIQLEIYRE